VDCSAPTEERAASFFLALQTELPDLRDPRGRYLDLAFVLTGVVLAQLSGCTTVSSIYRFIELKLDWLRRVTGRPCAAGPSRARLLAGVNYFFRRVASRNFLTACLTEILSERALSDGTFRAQAVAETRAWFDVHPVAAQWIVELFAPQATAK
jgi:hypothetical protein